MSRPGGRFLAVGTGAAIGLGLCARFFHALEWPPGPWIDEIYFLRGARAAAGTLAAFWKTEPLAPPGFEVDLYPTHLYLAFVNAVDRLAGGGMISLRTLSIGSSVVLFLGALLLAREATRDRPREATAFFLAAVLLATSLWLLVPARWATDVVSTSAILVLAAAAGLAALRKDSGRLAALAGILLGTAQYGYVASRLALAIPVIVLLRALGKRDGRLGKAAATALCAAFVVALPLFLHLAAHPARLVARVGEVSIFSKPPMEAFRALGANLVDYAALFTLRGDVIQRHGDPSRPVVLPGVAVLAVAGAIGALKYGGRERLLLLAAAVFIAGGLLARDVESANASRISPAAPFILVLAALGGARLVELLPERRRRAGELGIALVVGVSAALDLSAFARWASSPGTAFGFDVADRLLAETLAGEIQRRPAEIFIHPRACRNVNVTDVLLGDPGDEGRRHVAVSALESDLPWTRVPRADVLYVAGPDAAAAAAMALGGAGVAESRSPDGRPAWRIFRIPLAAAEAESRRFFGRFALEPGEPAGGLAAREEGLYLVQAGAFSVRRLAPGRHALAAAAAPVIVWGPDGFVLPPLQ